MWPDRVSNPGPLTYETGVLTTALRGTVAFYDLEKTTDTELQNVKPITNFDVYS